MKEKTTLAELQIGDRVKVKVGAGTDQHYYTFVDDITQDEIHTIESENAPIKKWNKEGAALQRPFNSNLEEGYYEDVRGAADLEQVEEAWDKLDKGD